MTLVQLAPIEAGKTRVNLDGTSFAHCLGRGLLRGQEVCAEVSLSFTDLNAVHILDRVHGQASGRVTCSRVTRGVPAKRFPSGGWSRTSN